MGERVKKIRDNYNLTQTELGDKLGVTSSYISRVEHNKETPSDMFVKLFCQLFLIRKEWLLKGEKPIQKNPRDIATGLTWCLDIDSSKEVSYHLYQKFLEPVASSQEVIAINEGMKKFLDPELAMMIEYLKDKWQAGTDVQGWLKTEFKIDFRDFEEWQKKHDKIKDKNAAIGAFPEIAEEIKKGDEESGGTDTNSNK
jgi:transcriptional regulator with XRE-family HTH domain